jgi:hypothetical protein
VVFWGPNREDFRYALKFDFATTNNEAEYEAVLSAMEIVREMGVTGRRRASELELRRAGGENVSVPQKGTPILFSL